MPSNNANMDFVLTHLRRKSLGLTPRLCDKHCITHKMTCCAISMTCNNHPVGYWFPNMGWFHLNSIYLNLWCPGPCLLQAFKISKRYKSGLIWNCWSCQSYSAFHQWMRVNFKGTFFKEEKKLRTMIHFPLYSSWGIMNCLAPQFIIHVPSNVTCNLTLSQTCVFYLPLMMWPILILSLRDAIEWQKL